LPSLNCSSQQPAMKAGIGMAAVSASISKAIMGLLPWFGSETTAGYTGRRSEFVGGARQFGQAGRRHRLPAALQPCGDMVPVDPRPVEGDPDPVGPSVISRAEVEGRFGLDRLGHLVLAAAFDQHADRFLA